MPCAPLSRMPPFPLPAFAYSCVAFYHPYCYEDKVMAFRVRITATWVFSSATVGLASAVASHHRPAPRKVPTGIAPGRPLPPSRPVRAQLPPTGYWVVLLASFPWSSDVEIVDSHASQLGAGIGRPFASRRCLTESQSGIPARPVTVLSATACSLQSHFQVVNDACDSSTIQAFTATAPAHQARGGCGRCARAWGSACTAPAACRGFPRPQSSR